MNRGIDWTAVGASCCVPPPEGVWPSVKEPWHRDDAWTSRTLPETRPCTTSRGGGATFGENPRDRQMARTRDNSQTGCGRHWPRRQPSASWERVRGAAPAVVRQPWGGARGGQKWPGSGGARRWRAKRRRSMLRPAERLREGRPGQDQGRLSARRLGRAGERGPGRRRGRCRGDDGACLPAYPRPLHRTVFQGGSLESLPGSAREPRGRQANRHSWPEPTGRNPRP